MESVNALRISMSAREHIANRYGVRKHIADGYGSTLTQCKHLGLIEYVNTLYIGMGDINIADGYGALDTVNHQEVCKYIVNIPRVGKHFVNKLGGQ